MNLLHRMLGQLLWVTLLPVSDIGHDAAVVVAFQGKGMIEILDIDRHLGMKLTGIVHHCLVLQTFGRLFFGDTIF